MARRPAEDMEKHGGDGGGNGLRHHAIRIPLTAPAPGPVQFFPPLRSYFFLPERNSILGSLLRPVLGLDYPILLTANHRFPRKTI
jgi:hypothetical protein